MTAGAGPRAGRPEGPEFFLRTRVARRVFLLFVLSSLAPLAAFAYLTLHEVDGHLRSQAAEQLHREARDAGMVLLGRLRLAVAEFDLAAEKAAASRPADAPRSSTRKTTASSLISFDAFTAAELEGESSHRRPLEPAVQRALSSAAERRSFCVAGGPAEAPHVYLVGLVRSSSGANLACAARLNAAFLWEKDQLVSATCDVAILLEGAAPQRLFSSAGTWPDAGAAPTEGDHNSNEVAWSSPEAPAVARKWLAFGKPLCGASFEVSVRRPWADFNAPHDAFVKSFLIVAALALALTGLVGSIQIRRTIAPIAVLQEGARRIGAKDLAHRVVIETRDEFADLGRTFNEMAGSLEHHVETIETVNDIGRALTAEHDAGRLAARIADAAWPLFRADGCAVYLADDDDRLQMQVLRIRSARQDRPHEDDRFADALVGAGILGGALPVNIADVRSVPPAADVFAAFDARHGYRTVSLITVPFRDHEDRLIGALQLLNALDPATGEVRAFPPDAEDLALSVASQAAVALTNGRLVAEFKRLFDGLIELLATAIDEKSPYTGGHCRRVPELAMMLADEVGRASEGVFAGVRFTPEELYELRVAALLHDCGKVTTPVHIVDKATKLETIFDRVHLVDARFAVVKSEARLAACSAALARLGAEGAKAAADAEAEVGRLLTTLDHDRNFVRRANRGGEFMSKDDQARIREIGRRTWTDPEGVEAPLLSDEETKNLCIERGTLNAEERAIINQHVTGTIHMLEKLPYPRSLRNVTKIAGAHHERMDGRGYPLGLRRDDITLQGRILGLADIFEALTAKDRPYKPGRTLSEAITILGRMKDDGHVDPDLYELFLSSRVFATYGDKFLDAAQMDLAQVEAAGCRTVRT